jgi:hypothetical protein
LDDKVADRRPPGVGETVSSSRPLLSKIAYPVVVPPRSLCRAIAAPPQLGMTNVA